MRIGGFFCARNSSVRNGRGAQTFISIEGRIWHLAKMVLRVAERAPSMQEMLLLVGKQEMSIRSVFAPILKKIYEQASLGWGGGYIMIACL